MALTHEVENLLTSKQDRIERNPRFATLSQFFDRMVEAGLIQKTTYTLPLTDNEDWGSFSVKPKHSSSLDSRHKTPK